MSNLRKFLSRPEVAFFLSAEMVLGIFLSFGAIFLFVKLAAEVFEQPIFYYDRLISNLVYGLRSPLLTGIMLLVTQLGGGYILVPAALITIFLIARKHQEEAFLFSAILVMGLVLNASLKSLLQRPRPNIAPLTNETSYSFPSGHAMNSFVFFTTISFYFFRFTPHPNAPLVRARETNK